MSFQDQVDELETIDPQMESSWKLRLWSEFQKPYFRELKAFLSREKEEGYIFYPPGSKIFNAFELTPFDSVKVVILGQDPYHGPGQAHGLSFSVMPPTPPPPSLKNIFKELKQDLGMNPPLHGELSSWAREGVLLLNTVLTVRAKNPGSHRGRGWENFTSAVISLISQDRSNIAFVLWGRDAQAKETYIHGDHLIIKSSHPSPYSAHNGFLGSKPFSRINNYLNLHSIRPINWQLP